MPSKLGAIADSNAAILELSDREGVDCVIHREAPNKQMQILANRTER